MSFNYTDTDEFAEDLTHQRANTGALARFLNWALPPDPRAAYVWPALAHMAVKKVSSLWRLVPIAVLLLAGTATLVYVLLAVPGLNYSVVGLLTSAFEWIVPRN